MKLGIDRLLEDTQLRSALEGKRVALLGHPASVSSQLEHSLDLLAECSEIDLVAGFGPQHGMKGEKQDNMVETEDYLDPQYKIPIFSLYGEFRRPTAEMMDTFDVVLIDLQDVGTRIYTFLTTLCYMLEAAAEKKKTVWVLDRPNPAGRGVEGLKLHPGNESFVGVAPIPMRHGMTLGEMGSWYIAHKKLDVDYRVIEMEGYQIDGGPGYDWPCELSWVNPSPNITTPMAAKCFPGTVMIEGTTLSEGRGTTRPLELVGAPDIEQKKLFSEMQKHPAWLGGCFLRFCYFEPTFHKHVGQMCQGFQIHVDSKHYDQEKFKPYRLIALWLKSIRKQLSDYPIWRDFHYEYEEGRLAIDIINGSSLLREWVDDPSATPDDFEKVLQQDELFWREERQAHLIY